MVESFEQESAMMRTITSTSSGSLRGEEPELLGVRPPRIDFLEVPSPSYVYRPAVSTALYSDTLRWLWQAVRAPHSTHTPGKSRKRMNIGWLHGKVAYKQCITWLVLIETYFYNNGYDSGKRNWLGGAVKTGSIARERLEHGT